MRPFTLQTRDNSLVLLKLDTRISSKELRSNLYDAKNDSKIDEAKI